MDSYINDQEDKIVLCTSCECDEGTVTCECCNHEFCEVCVMAHNCEEEDWEDGNYGDEDDWEDDKDEQDINDDENFIDEDDWDEDDDDWDDEDLENEEDEYQH